MHLPTYLSIYIIIRLRILYARACILADNTKVIPGYLNLHQIYQATSSNHSCQLNWVCAMFFPQHFGHWVEGGLHPPPWVGQVELDPTRRASTVCTDLRRHSIISQPQGSDDPSLLLATPESRVELLHNLGLNRESEAHGTPWGNGENWRVIGCGSKGFEMFRNYSKLPRSE